MARKRRYRWSWRRQIAFLNSALTLAAWRWRQQWSLLLTTGIGVIAAIVLVCSLPLFSDIMLTAGLRNVLRAQSNSAQVLATINLPGISTQLVRQASAQVNSQIRGDTGRYIQGDPELEIETPPAGFVQPGPTFSMSLYGVSFSTARSHLHLLQGRLPIESGSRVEILLTRSAAKYLGNIKVGDSLTLQMNYLTALVYTSSSAGYSLPLTVHVVGIFQADRTDAYWDTTDFEAPPPIAGTPQPPFLGLTSRSVLFNLFDSLARQHQAEGIFNANTLEYYSVNLAYYLHTTGIVSSDLDDLISRLYTLQKDITSKFTSSEGIYFAAPPYIINVTLAGPTLSDAALGGTNASTLEKYRNQEFVERTPALLLTAQVVCLILFFINIMSGVLVEQQQTAIAVMRSRGASRRQILGSLITQGLGLCLLAGLLGPFLATGLVYLVAPFFLTTGTRDAINALALNPLQTISALESYTLAAILVTLVTMSFSLYLAVRANILTQRREETRATRRPLWQRLRLDLVIAVLALLSYAFAVYAESANQQLNAQAQSLVSVPLELLAPLLLVLAGILFFLRLFPMLLRLLARLAQPGRNLGSMLALVQMERAPRQPMRMALLLGLATAFALFTFVFSASQSQRGQDLAIYQAVSDFGGYLVSATPLGAQENTPLTLASTTASYQRIGGVTSVTAGYVTNLYITGNRGIDGQYEQETVLQAVDASTFARTADWTSQDASQALNELMAQLIAQRPQALAQNIVPAIVAANTWQILNLHNGALFHLADDQGNPDPVTYMALAEVARIPPVDDSTQGALLVDFQTLASASGKNQRILQPNYVWLRSGDSPSDVAQVRLALTSGTFGLLHLVDRRVLLEENVTDPLARNLITILSIGVATALLLALLANVLLPILSVRVRFTNFAVLRALGTEPAQVTRLLTWEQGIVLVSALLLGLAFGMLLAMTAVPPLIFTGTSPIGALYASRTAIFTLQRIIPVSVILPPTVGLALAVLIVLCLLTLRVMTSLVHRPLVGQALRLNED